jgi:hypothetical protein
MVGGIRVSALLSSWWAGFEPEVWNSSGHIRCGLESHCGYAVARSSIQDRPNRACARVQVHTRYSYKRFGSEYTSRQTCMHTYIHTVCIFVHQALDLPTSLAMTLRLLLVLSRLVSKGTIEEVIGLLCYIHNSLSCQVSIPSFLFSDDVHASVI